VSKDFNVFIMIIDVATLSDGSKRISIGQFQGAMTLSLPACRTKLARSSIRIRRHPRWSAARVQPESAEVSSGGGEDHGRNSEQ
jgi:hypothetical protein